MMEDSQLFNYAVAAAVLILFSAVQYVQARKHDIQVPAVGPSGMFSSYYTGFKWISQADVILQEGYARFKGRAFKVSQWDQWHVIVSGDTLVEELRKAPDDQLSFRDAVADSIAMKWTIGRVINENQYHVPIIRSQLTRNLGAIFCEVKDEIVHAFNDLIPPTDEWIKRPALGTAMQIVCRTSNRIFVGLPLCRDPDYMQLNIDFTISVMKTASTLKLVPRFLWPIVGPLVTTSPKSTRRATKHLRPIIEDRQRRYAEYGKDYPDKPNDILTWLMDASLEDPVESTAKALSVRILTVNFAAIHTSSLSFTHALYHLASKPEYIAPMREEVESIIRQEGWTKTAISKMRKVDSFLKESQRFNGLSILSMTRKALQDFTFSDGTFIPKDTFVSVAATPTHRDAALYANAEVFDGFRFANMREEDGEGVKHQMVATNTEYLPFGHGRHACPGRFFAANELKAMMAYLVMTYDVKMENEGVRPADTFFVTSRIPDRKAEVMFRKRQN